MEADLEEVWHGPGREDLGVGSLWFPLEDSEGGRVRRAEIQATPAIPAGPVQCEDNVPSIHHCAICPAGGEWSHIQACRSQDGTWGMYTPGDAVLVFPQGSPLHHPVEHPGLQCCQELVLDEAVLQDQAFTQVCSD